MIGNGWQEVGGRWSVKTSHQPPTTNHLERQFQIKPHNTRATVGNFSIEKLPGAGREHIRCNASLHRRKCAGAGRAELRMIQQVKELRAEVQIQAFRDGDLLRQVHVPVVDAWRAQRVAPQVACAPEFAAMPMNIESLRAIGALLLSGST